jgi:hypothetical protein
MLEFNHSDKEKQPVRQYIGRRSRSGAVYKKPAVNQHLG